METPQYTVNPSIKSTIISQLLEMALLSIFFYAGIIVNLSILKIALPFYAKIGAALALVILSIMQIKIASSKTKSFHYDFYQSRLDFYGRRMESILYSEIEHVKLKRSLLDILSGTGTIVLSRKFSIKNVNNYKEIEQYLNSLVQMFQGGAVQPPVQGA